MSCISNAAYESAARRQADAIVTQARWDTLLQAGVALWQRNSSASIVNMQTEIADRQVKLAEQLQEHAEKFWPEEKELVDDVFAIAKTETQYTSLMNGWGGIAQDAMYDSRSDWLRTMNQRCMSPSSCENARWQRNTQVVRADVEAFAARQDEARTQILNDRRYELQVSVLSMGKGAFKDMMTYEQLRGQLNENASGILVNTINSALEAYGYYPARNAPDSWRVGIHDSFGQTVRMPTALPQARQQRTPASTQPIVPVGRVTSERLPAMEQPITKENEIDAGLEAYFEMLRFRNF